MEPTAEIEILISRVQPKGMALMLLSHCKVIDQTDELLVLRLDYVHRHLASRPYVIKLGESLQTEYGDHYKLIVEVSKMLH